jgi:Holliday junction resolvasome RuvABC endonuclease subunit
MKTVLAFDQAFGLTGWAVFRDGKAVACGRIDTRPKRFESLGARFLMFEREVRALFEEHKPDFVAFEEHRAHSGLIAAQVLGSVTSIVMKVAAEAGVDYAAVPVRTLKKHAVGTGFASKDLMFAAAYKKYAHLRDDIADDNVADALHIGAWGSDQIK